jgi:DNA-binding NtrC family response regulator
MTTGLDILLVEDEPVIVDAVTKICSAEGMSVGSAAHGAAGVEMLGKCSYRLIICDIMMADMDGFGFLVETARLNVRTPVVMASGYSTVENAVKSLSCGAMDFIPKPFTADELLAVVRRGLKYHALQEAAVAAGRPSADLFSCPARYHSLGYASWALAEEAGTVLVGVSDLFVKTLDGVRGVELLRRDEKVVQGSVCAVISSSAGLAHGVMGPVSGRIVEANTLAAADPALVEKDPYVGGWFYRILPSELEFDLRRLRPAPEGRT